MGRRRRKRAFAKRERIFIPAKKRGNHCALHMGSKSQPDIFFEKAMFVLSGKEALFHRRSNFPRRFFLACACQKKRTKEKKIFDTRI